TRRTPNATAISSRSVDFPEPFSPTKNVTGVSNRNSVRWRMAGTEYGYSRGSDPSERTRATVWMKMPGTVGASLGRRFFIPEGVLALLGRASAHRASCPAPASYVAGAAAERLHGATPPS